MRTYLIDTTDATVRDKFNPVFESSFRKNELVRFHMDLNDIQSSVDSITFDIGKEPLDENGFNVAFIIDFAPLNNNRIHSYSKTYCDLIKLYINSMIIERLNSLHCSPKSSLIIFVDYNDTHSNEADNAALGHILGIADAVSSPETIVMNFADEKKALDFTQILATLIAQTKSRELSNKNGRGAAQPANRRSILPESSDNATDNTDALLSLLLEDIRKRFSEAELTPTFLKHCHAQIGTADLTQSSRTQAYVNAMFIIFSYTLHTHTDNSFNQQYLDSIMPVSKEQIADILNETRQRYADAICSLDNCEIFTAVPTLKDVEEAHDKEMRRVLAASAAAFEIDKSNIDNSKVLTELIISKHIHKVDFSNKIDINNQPTSTDEIIKAEPTLKQRLVRAYVFKSVDKGFKRSKADVESRFNKESIAQESSYFMTRTVSGYLEWRYKCNDEALRKQLPDSNRKVSNTLMRAKPDLDVEAIRQRKINACDKVTNIYADLCDYDDIAEATDFIGRKYENLKKRSKRSLLSVVVALVTIVLMVFPYVATQNALVDSFFSKFGWFIISAAIIVAIYIFGMCLYSIRLHIQKTDVYYELEKYRAASEKRRVDDLRNLFDIYLNIMPDAEIYSHCLNVALGRVKERDALNKRLQAHKQLLYKLCESIEYLAGAFGIALPEIIHDKHDTCKIQIDVKLSPISDKNIDVYRMFDTQHLDSILLREET